MFIFPTCLGRPGCSFISKCERHDACNYFCQRFKITFYLCKYTLGYTQYFLDLFTCCWKQYLTDASVSMSVKVLERNPCKPLLPTSQELRQADKGFLSYYPRGLRYENATWYNTVPQSVTASTLNVSLHRFSAASPLWRDTWQTSWPSLSTFCKAHTDSYLQRERHEQSGTVERNTTLASQ